MLKSFKFRIYPNPSQEKKLLGWLNNCRFLYNSALEERISFYKLTGKSRNYVDQANLLSEVKEILPEFNAIHSQVCQDVLKRLDKAYKAFFNRIKKGNTPGFPRFKGRDRYNSFTFPQSGFSIEKNRLRLSKIGHIKIVQHREIIGKLKTCSIILNASGKWYACFSCEINNTISQERNFDNIIGLDLGITNFIITSNNNRIDSEKFLKKHLSRLKTCQMRKDKSIDKHKKSNWKQFVARIHEKITNCRSDWQHKVANRLIKDNDIIVVEKLNIKNIIYDSKFKAMKRSITDVSWGAFLEKLNYKAEWAGKLILEVNPRNTSKMCSRCGNIKEDLTLTNRIYHCDKCGMEKDRDYNAALNIKNLGLQQLNLLQSSKESLGIQTPVERSRSRSL